MLPQGIADKAIEAQCTALWKKFGNIGRKNRKYGKKCAFGGHTELPSVLIRSLLIRELRVTLSKPYTELPYFSFKLTIS